MCGGGGGSADRIAREQRAEEQARQARIAQGMAAIDRNFARFDDDFYNQRGQAYLDFAMPQLDQQYDDNYRALQFALARQGIGQSSEGNQRFGRLSQEYGLQRQGLVDRSMDVQAEARRAVEDARSGLVMDLQNTANPTAAAKAALNRSAYLGMTPSMQPIGQLFANTLDGLNTYQSAKADAEAYRAALGQYGLYNNSGGSGSGRNYGGP